MKNNSLLYPLKNFSYKPNGPKISKGEGVFLYDTDGNKYIDAISGLWNVSLGYNNKEINNAIIEQLNRLPFINSITEQSNVLEEYAEMLTGVLPENHNKILYTCSGSESVELAIKLVRKYNIIRNLKEKREIFSLKMSYHGTSYMAMALSAMDNMESKNYISLNREVKYLDVPYCKCCRQHEMSEKCRNKVLNNLIEQFNQNGNNVAAIIVEPIIGSGGIIPIPEWYMKKVEELCKQYDCLIIFDEVATGFGRTGKMFAYERMNIVPDVICMSKSINNGYIPFGAVSICDKIYNEYISSNQFVEHFSTQNGNLLACVAARSTLEILTQSTIIEDVNLKGEILKKGLEENLLNIASVSDIRGSGLMVGIDFKTRDKNPISAEVLSDLTTQIREKGLIVYMFYIENVVSGISLFPQYITNTDSLKTIIKILAKTINKKMKYVY